MLQKRVNLGNAKLKLNRTWELTKRKHTEKDIWFWVAHKIWDDDPKIQKEINFVETEYPILQHTYEKDYNI